MSAHPENLRFHGGDNPLLTNSASDDWHDLIEAVGPASILLIIEDRMSKALQNRMTPEDVLQESLLHAWPDRAKCEWRGIKSFRAWLLTLIDHRIRDFADYENAAKRGGGTPPAVFSVLQDAAESSEAAVAIASTTPSRVAIYREQASAMKEALESLSPELRDVVRFRLFEQLPMDEIAQRLDIGVSAVRHRFRKGAAVYRERLLATFSSRAGSLRGETPGASTADSSP